ncbi:hypothetical protein niasHT_011797 [Heterodera trifolii]|uniref:Uncharacterized protein n=1 Tax=Heterodera trifolii TaxID=157864 RepID=A0ABD2L5H7_9BILA
MSADISETDEALNDLNCLFFQMKNKKFSFSLMSKVAQKFDDGGVAAEIILPYSVYTEAIQLLASARFEIDYRVVIHFLPTFKAIFLRLSYDDWQRAMEMFFRVNELRQTHRGFPREAMHTLSHSYSLSLLENANFNKEIERTSEFLFTDYGESANFIDNRFEWHCRQLSFLILLEGPTLMDRIVNRVLEDRTETVMLNFVKFVKCTPGLLNCAPPVALLKKLREAVDREGQHLLLVRLKFGLTSQCDNIKRIEDIGQSSFGIVHDCGPLFDNSEKNSIEMAPVQPNRDKVSTQPNADKLPTQPNNDMPNRDKVSTQLNKDKVSTQPNRDKLSTNRENLSTQPNADKLPTQSNNDMSTQPNRDKVSTPLNKDKVSTQLNRDKLSTNRENLSTQPNTDNLSTRNMPNRDKLPNQPNKDNLSTRNMPNRDKLPNQLNKDNLSTRNMTNRDKLLAQALYEIGEKMQDEMQQGSEKLLNKIGQHFKQIDTKLFFMESKLEHLSRNQWQNRQNPSSSNSRGEVSRGGGGLANFFERKTPFRTNFYDDYDQFLMDEHQFRFELL